MVAQEAWRTISIATAGMTLAFIVAVPLSLLAVRCLSVSALVGRMNLLPSTVRLLARWVMVALRSVPELIWALVFVRVVGLGPTSGVMDERYKVAISRLGQRVRVAGSAELGGRLDQISGAAIQTLHQVLDDWYPGCAQQSQVQRWKGARPMLPDGPPAIGASSTPGVWVNTGHGSSGWALACGSARVVADLMAGRDPMVDAEPFSPLRWSRRHSHASPP